MWKREMVGPNILQVGGEAFRSDKIPADVGA